ITFNAGGIDFLVIALEYAPRSGVIKEANEIIKTMENKRKAEGKPPYKIIIETHSNLNPKSCIKNPKPNDKGYYGNTGYAGVDEATSNGFNKDALGGKEIYEQLTSRHNNIILVVNGHINGSFFRLNKGKAGNVFGELVVDYQEENGYKELFVKNKGKENEEPEKLCDHSHHNGGSGIGLLRVLHFDPDKVTITSTTHSTLGEGKFKDGKKRMYCNSITVKNDENKPVELYPANYSLPADYDIEADVTHASTNYHAFTVTGIDFVTPVEYKYTE
ncbi:MAG: hypothetical protein J6A01_04300, partial [Proteobacteria bacterium]|nr:hypothetical protein [Pseudomonadota bacterium]